MATKKATKKAAAPKERKRGQFTNCKIRKNVKDWPGKPGTLIAKSFELIRNGMTYEQYREAGGRYIDLVDAIKQGHISVE